MASYLTGSMNTFPNKLIKLDNRPEGEGIGQLEHHLVNLKERFFKVAGRGKTDDQAKEWMKQVRELFFDIEDWMDDKLETPKQGKDGQLRINMAGPSELEEEIKETNMAGPSELEEEIKETNKVPPFEVEEKIKGFIILAEEACGRCTRYKLVDESTPSGAAPVAPVTPRRPRVIPIDSRLLLKERPYLRALDRPVEVLRAHLTEGHQTELKVVSIVGTGGLGKTTLAKKIHEELQGKFECGAFVHVGHRNPSILSILTKILGQIGPYQQCSDEHDLIGKLWEILGQIGHYQQFSEHDLIGKLWAILKEKRYFIILDDLWSIQTWRVISCALPGNNLRSRILVTTRMKDVAKSCSPRYTDVVHQMEALSHDDSKRLFDQKTRTQVDDDVLKMCGGIPLAITVAAGLSTGKYTKPEELKMLGKHMLSSFELYYSLSPEMTNVLHMSYVDLSIPLRSCFLYMGVFREEYTIKKDHLICRWVAEGFIPRIDDQSLWVIGERYFNELISRRLIQPVYDYEDVQAVGCTVHPVILDFIKTVSREENFATTAAELSSGQFLYETIRRFSLDCSNEAEAVIFKSSTELLSSIRSLTISGDVREMPSLPRFSRYSPQDSPLYSPRDSTPYSPQDSPLYSPAYSPPDSPRDSPPYSPPDCPPYRLRPWAKNKDVHVSPSHTFSSPFKLLRVLDLGDATNLQESQLEGIGGLILLRYLRLATFIEKQLGEETGKLEQLGEEIGKLEQLETLDLRGARFFGLSNFIIKLRKLVHILFAVTDRSDLYFYHLLGKPELEEVSNIELGYISSQTLEHLRNIMRTSKRLRILGVSFRCSQSQETQYLVSFLEELANSKLECLIIYCREYNDDSFGILMDSWRNAATSADGKFEPRRFELRINPDGREFLERFPPHMDSLGGLTHLHIATENLEGLRILGNMQCLVLLKLSYKRSSAQRTSIKQGAFRSLLVLSLTCRHRGMGLQFEQGAMPQLRRLGLSFTVSRSRDSHGNFNFGMENLACLTWIQATINCDYAMISEVVDAEEQARKIVSEHMNKPILELSREHIDRMRT